MGEICLNALPLILAADPETVVGRVWTRNETFDEQLREHASHGEGFQHYSVVSSSYAWAWPGGELPDTCASRGQELKLSHVPARVIAYVGKRAAVAALEVKGFTLLSSRFGQPVSLSRHKQNLAEPLVAEKLPASVGAFSALKVQGLALGTDDSLPGSVALVIDQKVDYMLDIELMVLDAHGVDLTGARLHWRHHDSCSCDHGERVGDAGRLLGGDASGQLLVRDPGGTDVSLPARCLAVHANRLLLTRYLASVSGKSERTISEGLYAAVNAFAKTDKRWDNLTKTAQAFTDLELFDGVHAKVGAPLVVPQGNKVNGSGPVTLPVLAEGDLNFHYGTPKLAKQATAGLKDHGPYDEGQNRHDVLRAVIVAPTEFEAEAKKLRTVLMQGIQAFKGLKRRYRLRSFDCDIELFSDASWQGYAHASLNASKSAPDIVFLVTKYDYRYARRCENPYFAAKAALASAGIASQAVTIETLHQADSSLQWSSDSVGLAAYTKVGNVPFVLHDPEGGKRELVLGLARSDVYDYQKGARRQIFGSSVAVRQDGDFLFAGSTAGVSEVEDYQDHVQRLIGDNISRFEQQQGDPPERLVIYLFKQSGWRERVAIEKALDGRDIEFALLHVNRDSPLWLVDRAPSRIILPQRGLTVALRDTDRLLITGDPRKSVGSHPLRLELDRFSTYTDMDRLVRQAFGFTKTSYRGFLQSNEPSPMKFGRLLAEKVEQLVPYGFDPSSASGPLGERPWFI